MKKDPVGVYRSGPFLCRVAIDRISHRIYNEENTFFGGIIWENYRSFLIG